MAAKSRCHVCDQRKGKRPCPARSAPICPRCCAQNRVVEIDCPVDCPFLGAEGSMLLAARQGEDVPLPISANIGAFVAELMDAVPRVRIMDEAEPAAISTLRQLLEFVDDEDDATLQGAIWEWLVFGALDLGGQPMVDRIITRLHRPLTEPERSVLRGLHDSHYGLFTLESFPSPDTAKVRDLLTDEIIDLHLAGIQERHEVGKTLACFVTSTQTGLEVVGGAWELPGGAEDSFPLRLGELRDESPHKDVPLPDFLTRFAILVPLLMFEHFGEQKSGDAAFPPPSF